MRYRIVRHYQVKDSNGRLVQYLTKIIKRNLRMEEAASYLLDCFPEGKRLDPYTGKTFFYKTAMEKQLRAAKKTKQRGA